MIYWDSVTGNEDVGWWQRYKKHGFYSVDDFFELMRDEYGYCIGSEQKTRYKSCEFKGFECMENITTDEERQVLNKRYANVKLDRIPPRSEWMTVEEMRSILKKENEEFYSKNRSGSKWKSIKNPMGNITTADERQELDKRYANVKLDRLPPCSQLVTVEEMENLSDSELIEYLCPNGTISIEELRKYVNEITED